MSFPKNFMWGASSSSAQIEGAYDVDGKGLTTWDYDKKRINPGCCSFKYALTFIIITKKILHLWQKWD
ncbi:MAG: family 1 glycosylhydrolase [Clostridium paraputrificum]